VIGKQYPQGTFSALARQRLASVSQQARAADLRRFDGAWNVTSSARRTRSPLAM